MRGKAFTQIKPFVQQIQAGTAPNKVDKQMLDFNKFKERVKPIFRVLNKPTIIQRKIQRVCQTKSATNYTTEFQQLAANTNQDNTALITIFKQGLKPQVKIELICTSASTNNLNNLINTAININIKLYKLQQELCKDLRLRVVLANKRPLLRNLQHNNLSNYSQRSRYY